MSVFETFSKRKKRLENAGKDEVYVYDVLPQSFRVQVVHIWNGAIGRYSRQSGYSSSPESPANELWEFICSTMCRERGEFSLGKTARDSKSQCIEFLLTSEVLGALDIIELSFRVIDSWARKLHPYSMQAAGITEAADDAIEELNHRFRGHSLGYQYLEGKLIRVDSQFLHAEAIKPALGLLSQPGFDGPAEEFIRAFDHFRHDRNKEAIAEALKAFESTMKTICKIRGWAHDSNATAKPLIDTLLKNGLIPAKLENHFAGLRGALESGLPTVSNPNRHGQGSDPVTVPSHMVAYALHLTAANIVLLVQAHNSLK